MPLRAFVVTAIALVLPTLHMSAFSVAADPDPRLADVRRGLAAAVDDLAFDRPVAVCFSERLARMTPIEPVKELEMADVVFRISARMASDAERSLSRVGGTGPGGKEIDLRTTSSVRAELPDGTLLWSEEYLHGTDHGDGVECRVADDLLGVLRDAMRAARDTKASAQ